MGLFDSYKIGRAINALSSVESATSAEAIRAIRNIRDIGPAIIPKLIQAHETALHPEIINDLLTGFVNNATLHYFMEALADSNHRISNNTAVILRQTSHYDPNKLIELLERVEIPKDTLINILECRKDKLNYKQLLSALSKIPASVYPMIFKLISGIAHPDMLQELMGWLNHKSPIIRTHIARIISRFSTEATCEALLKLLEDDNKNVRLAALEGLKNLQIPVSAKPICKLLSDGDMTVQAMAIDTLSKIHDKNTIKYLVEILQDESEYVRRAAVEVLNEVGDEHSVKDLLNTLRDQDWWVKVRAADALGSIGGPRVVDGALALIKDEDEFLRRTAVEILNRSKDERAITYLVDALDDNDWWVRERAIDALGLLKDTRAVDPLIKQLGKHPQTTKVAIRALANIGENRAIEAILNELNSTEDDSIRKEALRALEVLTDDTSAEKVRQSVTQLIDIASPTVRQVATRTRDSIMNRTIDDNDQTVLLSTAPHAPSAPVPEPPLNPMTLAPGQMIAGRYRVVQRIGKGAMGVVFLVIDQAINDQVALKFLTRYNNDDDNTLRRFTQELRFARKITHENIIRIYDFIDLQHNHAISMEYFSSHSLSDEMANKQLQETARTLGILIDICKGMQVAQDAKVVHRDLKPANILINDESKVKIVDFGISAASSQSDSRLTKSGMLIGTPTYMSPEQAHGNPIDSRTDIYSLGIIMYEIFTGKAPYDSDSPMSTMLLHVEGKATPPREINPDIPESIAKIIGMAMATDPKKRFQSFDELRQSLEQALQEID